MFRTIQIVVILLGVFMYNFQYHNPTRIIFGDGEIKSIEALIPANSKVLMVYGGGSIHKNGVYSEVKKALDAFQVLEFSGVEPNPKYETCMKAVELVQKESVDFLLAVGGGSVLDATKFIALAAKFQGVDPWDFMVGKAEVPQEAVPLASIMTLPATGSEMNASFVISRESTQEKFGGYSEFIRPVFSVIDPKTTVSLPERQTANGVVDTFVHTMEQYATFPNNAPLQDRQAEAILLTLVEEGPKVLKKPEDYNVRANLCWCATQALNGIISSGMPQDWSSHEIGHELTALYGIDHARTLAVVLPGVWSYFIQEKQEKLAQYARRVWRVEGDTEVCAKAAIQKTEEFFESLGVGTRLKDYGVSAKEAASAVQLRFQQRNRSGLGERGLITPEIVAQIIESRA